MAYVKINCLQCNVEHNVLQKEIKRGFGKFCSKQCGYNYRLGKKVITETNVSCGYCHKEFYKNSFRQSFSKSGLFFCCREHKDAAQRTESKTLILPHYTTGISVYRDIAFRSKVKQCERCNYNANMAAIIVHHIDRNRDNNDISNLEVLCCNCHAIEHLGEEHLNSSTI